MKLETYNIKRVLVVIFLLSAVYFLFFITATNAQVVDITPSGLWWSPNSPIESDNVFIGFGVKNIGDKSSGPFQIQINRDNTTLCTRNIPSVNPSQSFEVSPTSTSSCMIYLATTPGYTITLIADNLKQISESNEFNNATSTFLTVTPVNIEPGEPSVPGVYIPPRVIQSPLPVSLPSVPSAPSVPSTQSVTPQNQQPSSPNIGNFDFLKGIVPCGTSYASHACTVCDFFVLIQNIINFLLYAFASLATLAVIYIAFLFMFSGGSPAKIIDAKGKLWLVVIGIFWVLGSWLVLNTILNFMVDKSVFPWPWNQINCEVSQPSLPLTSPLARLDQAGIYEDAIQINTPGYQALDTEHFGLEQVDPGYSSTIPAVDKTNINGVDPNLVKAIIQAESSGNKNAIHVDRDGKASFGLMQVRPDTAKRYDSNLISLSDAQIGERLKDPDYNVEIGTAYLQDLASKYGDDLNKVVAAYNGGPGANKPSVDCPGSMRWQCQWDNTAQTVPNTGYAVTRNYVTKVNSYYSQLSK